LTETPGASDTVTLVNLTKRYGATRALDGVSLSVAPGEFFTLLGPSGCGKTTTLRSVAGFVTPDAGEVAINGRTVTRVPPHPSAPPARRDGVPALCPLPPPHRGTKR